MNQQLNELFSLLDWNNSENNQSKGREIARSINDLTVLMQPLTEKFSKNVWDNCAIVLCEKSDKELEPYLNLLLEWLQDFNWPGSLLILSRLESYQNQELLVSGIENCIEKAKLDNDFIWIENMMKLTEKRCQ